MAGAGAELHLLFPEGALPAARLSPIFAPSLQLLELPPAAADGRVFEENREIPSSQMRVTDLQLNYDQCEIIISRAPSFFGLQQETAPQQEDLRLGSMLHTKQLPASDVLNPSRLNEPETNKCN